MVSLWWRVRVEWSGEKSFFLQYAFPLSIFFFGCHRNDLSQKGKEFFQSHFSRSVQHSTTFYPPRFNIWPLVCRRRMRDTEEKENLFGFPPVPCPSSLFCCLSVVFTAFPSLPHCVEQTLQCWLNLATGVTVLAQMSTSIAFTSCWGVKLSCSSLLFCAGHQEHKNKISRLFASEGLLTR